MSPMSPTPGPDELDMISPKLVPGRRSGRQRNAPNDWRTAMAPPHDSSSSLTPKQETVSPPLTLTGTPARDNLGSPLYSDDIAGKSRDRAHDDSDDDAATADDDEHDELNIIGNDGTQDAHVIDTGYASDPRSYKEAMSRSVAAEWAQAFTEEMAAHERNSMWELIECPPGVCPVDNRWVLKTKRCADGTIKRLKARLVARGFTQRPGIDYFETYAPTAPPPAICTTTALAAALDLHLHSIDISNAFLNGDIDADIYMCQPEGFVLGGRNMVCKLNKGIYGTKQGARVWEIKLRQILVEELGFCAIYSAGSIFVYRNGNDLVLLPFHVDDGTFASSSHELNKTLVARLAQFFKLRDLGPTEFPLSIAVKQDLVAGTVELSQCQYMIEILNRFAMSSCASVTTPMALGLCLSRADSPQTDEECTGMTNVPHGNAIGALLYLATSTRPDISFTVATLCHFIANPGVKHWNAVKHLLHYLQGTKDARLVYRHDLFDLRNMFTAYCDADHAGNVDNGCSTGGYVLLIAGAAVSWSSRLQTITALSTTEAEYVAAVDAGKEVVEVCSVSLAHLYGHCLLPIPIS